MSPFSERWNIGDSLDFHICIKHQIDVFGERLSGMDKPNIIELENF